MARTALNNGTVLDRFFLNKMFFYLKIKKNVTTKEKNVIHWESNLGQPLRRPMLLTYNVNKIQNQVLSHDIGRFVTRLPFSHKTYNAKIELENWVQNNGATFGS